MSTQPDRFERFNLSQRIQHVGLMITFTVLAVTGVPQKFSSMPWAQSVVNLFGGIDLVRTVHHISAVLLLAGVAYHVVSALYPVLRRRVRFEMLPNLRDVLNLFHNLAYFIGFRNDRPRFDRYSYMEKFEYWGVIWGMALMGLTGLMLWFPGIVTQLVPGEWIAAAKSAHGGEALLAVAVIVLWHLYNAHFNPRVFPFNASIFTGYLSRHEMMAEHPLEYERRTGEPVPEEIFSDAPQYSRSAVGISALLGAVLVLVFGLLIYWAIFPPAPVLNAPLNQVVSRERLVTPVPTMTLPAPAPGAGAWQANVSPAPVALFKVVRFDSGDLASTYQFTDLSGGEIAQWRWDFGDGSASDERNPMHTFTQCPGANGACAVSLTVCGPGGCDTATLANSICVGAACLK